MKTLSRLATALVAALVFALLAPGPPASAAAPTPVVLRVGTNRALGTVTPHVGRARGLFQARGIELEIVDFADGSTLMEAFAAGRLDLALQGIAPAAIWQAKGLPLKVIAAANGGGHVLLTRQDTGVVDLAGLRGKKVGTPKPGTVVDTLFRAHVARERAGLDPEKDLVIVPGLAPADMPAALFVAREVDAVITWEPFASQAQAQYPGARVLFDAALAWRKEHPGRPLYPVNVVVARQDLIDGRPDDVRRFLAAYDEAIGFINGNPAEANVLIARELKLEPAVVAAARTRIEYGARVDVKAAIQTLAWSHRLGYLKAIPDERALFDLRFLPPVQAEAARR